MQPALIGYMECSALPWQRGEMKATLDKKLKPLEQGVSEAGACIVAARLRQVYAGLRQPDFDAPPELEGNSMAEAPEIESSQLPMSSVAQVNLVVFFIILLMTIVTSLGYLWEACAKAVGPDFVI